MSQEACRPCHCGKVTNLFAYEIKPGGNGQCYLCWLAESPTVEGCVARANWQTSRKFCKDKLAARQRTKPCMFRSRKAVDKKLCAVG
jgi:hypothetical protein